MSSAFFATPNNMDKIHTKYFGDYIGDIIGDLIDDFTGVFIKYFFRFLKDNYFLC